MSDITSNLLDAISTVVNGELKNLKFDKTIEATIKEFVDADTGEYKVYYEGATFSAFSNDIAVVYEVNDSVLVKIPEGDMTKKKSIEGKVSANLSYKEKSKLSKFIAPVGPTFDKLFDYDAEARYGLIAGISDPLTIYDSEETPASDLAIANLIALGEDNDKLQLKANFSTALRNTHVRGNYGLRVYFDVQEYNEQGEEETQQVYFTLDLGSFIGSPYNLSQPSPQSICVEVKKSYLKDLRKIEFFQDNFAVDSWTELRKNGTSVEEITVNNDTVPNLFVQDIELGYIANYDLSDDLYHLVVDAPDGVVLGSQDAELVAHLYYAGAEVVPSSSYWFRENPNITVGSSSYVKSAGPGWEKVGEGTSLVVTSTYVPYKKKYKNISYYNDLSYSDEIELRKLNSEYDYKIVQSTDKSDINLTVVKYKTDSEETVNVIWFLDADGNYEQLTSSAVEKLTINSYLTHVGVHFIAYADEIKLETVINNISSKDNLSVTFIGTETYQYDANGDIDIDNQEGIKSLAPTIAWSEGYGTSYTLKWYHGNTQLTQSPTAETEDSMMYGLYIEDNILYYNIKPKFDPNAIDNTITLKVITSGNISYSFDREIIFLKDGDQGTNGTSYSVVVRPTDGASKLTGFYPVFASGVKDTVGYEVAYSDWEYKAYLYRDGVAYEGTIVYEWQGTNLDFIVDGVYKNKISSATAQTVKIGRVNCNDGIINYSLTLSVKITDPIDDTKVITLYNIYPIQVVFGNGNVTSDYTAEYERKKYIVGIPSTIKYNSSGYVPTYANEALRVGYDVYLRRAIGYFTPLNEEVLNVVSKGYDVTYLDPAVMFNYDKGTGSLKCQVYGSSHYIIYTIIMYLNTFGNEAINGWDGTSITTEDGTILAPQIGAGTKDDDNKFTGVVMGKDTAQDKVGLYGYQEGVSSFGLMEDGKAFFGKSGAGRIEIDGTSGTIEGGGGGEEASGMTIKLNSDGTGGTYGLQLGGNNFYVTYGGFLHSLSGEIGGWNIESGELSSYDSTKVSDPGIHLYSENQDSEVAIGGSQTKSDWRITAGSSFGVDNDGNLYANSGFIGGWRLNSDKLTSTGSGTVTTLFAKNQSETSTICGHTASDWRIGVGSLFGVDSSGWMYASQGTIAGWIVDGDNIYKSNGTKYTYLNASGNGSTSLNSSGSGSTSFRSGASSKYQITTTSLYCSGDSYIEASTIKNLTVTNAMIESLEVDKLTIGGHSIGKSIYYGIGDCELSYGGSSRSSGYNLIYYAKLNGSRLQGYTLDTDSVWVSGIVSSIEFTRTYKWARVLNWGSGKGS